MSERISAYRIDEGQKKMRVVEVDEFANWQSLEGGVKTIHIEGDDINLCVEYDFNDPHPLPEASYVQGRMPPRERAKLLVIKFKQEPPVGFVVYDARRGNYPDPVDEEGELADISPN